MRKSAGRIFWTKGNEEEPEKEASCSYKGTGVSAKQPVKVGVVIRDDDGQIGQGWIAKERASERGMNIIETVGSSSSLLLFLNDFIYLF